MENFTPVSGLIGGLLIGLASLLLFLGTGRVAGISGIVGGLLKPQGGDRLWRLLFVAGLLLGGLGWLLASDRPLPVDLQAGWPGMIAAGLLVGFGARLGSGCTSGHGVCGIGRLSARSIVATVSFMVTAGLTVFITRHLIGG
ncbi:YeeE/YedE family protein [Alkalilimnicola sp. S0819]|uniref:YeeE/YedE family protein n=1 Tax=Alkalilimnicola sp. S0819 TaxID=2613922 RepID=UPI001261EBA2|nr:YeeE/YedE family protein [Alkalilimnicola sp. S0819]KAB7628148.1 YeeE/YedE family protein [Alkalilimnicola sp. S0819]MPQ15034.1 YeeE/YedE family protein [Alkalilimnicola sp. S0819]